MHLTQKIKVLRKEHRGKQVLILQFAYNEQLVNLARSLPESRYTNTFKGWWLPWSKENLDAVFVKFRHKAWLELAFKKTKPTGEKEVKQATPKTGLSTKFRFSASQKKAMHAMAAKLITLGYSDNTYRTYGHFFKAFLVHFPSKAPEEITVDEIQAYLLETIKKGKISGSTQNQMVNALKFYYEKVLGLPRHVYNLDRPKRGKALPKVISQNAFVKMIVHTPNLKHQMILSCLYSAGLRRSELINLRIADIDSDRMQLWVRNGKGKKDRVTLLSERLLGGLRSYVQIYKPKEWLFESPAGGKYSPSSVGIVVKEAAQRAGLKKRVTPHMMRHSFATHLQTCPKRFGCSNLNIDNQLVNI